MREKSSYKLIVGQLNINSIRNKFEFLEDVINRKKLDIILLWKQNLMIHFLQLSLFQKDMLGLHIVLAGTPKVGDFYSIFVKTYLRISSNSDLTVFVLR